jgi:hypothetical protein
MVTSTVLKSEVPHAVLERRTHSDGLSRQKETKQECLNRGCSVLTTTWESLGHITYEDVKRAANATG